MGKRKRHEVDIGDSSRPNFAKKQMKKNKRNSFRGRLNESLSHPSHASPLLGRSSTFQADSAARTNQGGSKSNTQISRHGSESENKVRPTAQLEATAHLSSTISKANLNAINTSSSATAGKEAQNPSTSREKSQKRTNRRIRQKINARHRAAASRASSTNPGRKDVSTVLPSPVPTASSIAHEVSHISDEAALSAGPQPSSAADNKSAAFRALCSTRLMSPPRNEKQRSPAFTELCTTDLMSLPRKDWTPAKSTHEVTNSDAGGRDQNAAQPSAEGYSLPVSGRGESKLQYRPESKVSHHAMSSETPKSASRGQVLEPFGRKALSVPSYSMDSVARRSFSDFCAFNGDDDDDDTSSSESDASEASVHHGRSESSGGEESDSSESIDGESELLRGSEAKSDSQIHDEQGGDGDSNEADQADDAMDMNRNAHIGAGEIAPEQPSEVVAPHGNEAILPPQTNDSAALTGHDDTGSDADDLVMMEEPDEARTEPGNSQRARAKKAQKKAKRRANMLEAQQMEGDASERPSETAESINEREGSREGAESPELNHESDMDMEASATARLAGDLQPDLIGGAGSGEEEGIHRSTQLQGDQDELLGTTLDTASAPSANETPLAPLGEDADVGPIAATEAVEPEDWYRQKPGTTHPTDILRSLWYQTKETVRKPLRIAEQLTQGRIGNQSTQEAERKDSRSALDQVGILQGVNERSLSTSQDPRRIPGLTDSRETQEADSEAAIVEGRPRTQTAIKFTPLNEHVDLNQSHAQNSLELDDSDDDSDDDSSYLTASELGNSQSPAKNDLSDGSSAPAAVEQSHGLDSVGAEENDPLDSQDLDNLVTSADRYGIVGGATSANALGDELQHDISKGSKVVTSSRHGSIDPLHEGVHETHDGVEEKPSPHASNGSTESEIDDYLRDYSQNELFKLVDEVLPSFDHDALTGPLAPEHHSSKPKAPSPTVDIRNGIDDLVDVPVTVERPASSEEPATPSPDHRRLSTGSRKQVKFSKLINPSGRDFDNEKRGNGTKDNKVDATPPSSITQHPRYKGTPLSSRIRRTLAGVSPTSGSKAKRKNTGKTSQYFTSPTNTVDPAPAIATPSATMASPTQKRRVAGMSSVPFPPTTAPKFGLAQEKLWAEPFWLLVAVKFLNRTRGNVSMPVFWKLKEQYPTPETLAAIDEEDLYPLLIPLGLHTQRARSTINMAKMWLTRPPRKGVQRRTLHYPLPGDGEGIAPSEVVDADADECAGLLEIGQLPGCKDYAYDSWRIFCRDVLRGVAEDFNGKGSSKEGFTPEWKRVLPKDKELRAFLRWMWLREGSIWNCVNGERRPATQEEIETAREGSFDDPYAAEQTGAVEQEDGSQSAALKVAQMDDVLPAMDKDSEIEDTISRTIAEPKREDMTSPTHLQTSSDLSEADSDSDIDETESEVDGWSVNSSDDARADRMKGVVVIRSDETPKQTPNSSAQVQSTASGTRHICPFCHKQFARKYGVDRHRRQSCAIARERGEDG